MDEDVPIVATSKHVVVNTITAADDYLKMIQPSPSASPVYETNTYYSTVEFSKTINDDEITKVINTQDVITQVIVTESLPHGRMPMSMSHDLIEPSNDNSELSPSDYDEAEIQDYIKKTNAIELNPTRIDQKPASDNVGSTAIPLHFYATKTYLTTFTYFTTLLQNAAGNDGEISSTIVDSHTRIIENVITETIPSSMLQANVMSSISKKFFDGEKHDLKTRVTLKNGQKLEITAANILKPVDYATATKISSIESNDLEAAGNEYSPSSVLLSSDEVENLVDDSESSEEIVALPPEPIKYPSNNIKPKPANTGSGSLKIPSLLNGITMPNLSALGPALGPMFNAMAGLIQNNFASPTVNKIHVQPLPPPHNLPRPIVEHEQLPQPQPLFSQESQDIILGQTDSKNKYPLYIPVRGSNEQNPSSGEIINLQHHHHHSNHHASMMGSGIPISPGEIITTNSDVIVGKPAIIGPKLPPILNNPQEISGLEAPPFFPLKTPVRSSSFVKDIKSNGNINHVVIKKGDDYSGPVPPKEIHIPAQSQHRPIPINQFPRQPPPQNLQKIQPVLPPMLRPQYEGNNFPQRHPGNILLPKPLPTQESQMNNQYFKINQNQNVKQINRDPIRHQNIPVRDQRPHQPNFNGVSSIQNVNPHNQHRNERPQYFGNSNINYQQHNNQQPNVIEIQKIPEVYSTDLPIITIHNHHHYRPSEGSGIITHDLPEILDKPSAGQPLLVDIQPSQVANVVIPHGSSSILVYGGVHEAHKVGQYFNEPSPHGNGEFGISSVNLLADIAGNGNNKEVQQQGQGAQVQYDVKDNIIVASENNPVPSPDTPGIVGSNQVLTHSASGNDYYHHSINISPESVLRFHPGSELSFNRPSNEQLINQQIQQQVHIDEQLRQKQIENHKRMEAEHQRHREYEKQQQLKQIELQKRLEDQKRLEFEQQRRLEDQKRFEIEQQKIIEDQKRFEIEQQKIIEDQKRFEFEQQQKIAEQKRYEHEQQQKRFEDQIRMEQQKRLEYEKHQQQIEQQKRFEFEQKQKIEQQKRQQDAENQKRIQDQKMRQQFEQKLQNDLRKPLQHNFNYNIRPSVIIPHHSPAKQESFISSQNNQQSGFIILHGNSNLQSQNHVYSHPINQQQPPFIPIKSQPQTNHKADDSENETDSDGHVVQESINHLKLPGGQNLETVDEDVKEIDEFDNFVYHKIADKTTEATTKLHSQVVMEVPVTTHRAPFISSATEKIIVTPETQAPVYITQSPPKSYLNQQFENLPKLVNELQPSHPLTRPTLSKYNKPVKPYGSGQSFKFNGQAVNTLSQSMRPPAPPKLSRRPTLPARTKTTFRISMPIDPMPDDVSVVNNLQTEEPFDPRYTQDAVTQPSLTTQGMNDNLKPSDRATTSSTTQKLSTTTVKEVPETTKNIDLNIGEIEMKDKNKTFVDDSDIFDSKETINPLNHGFVKHKDVKDDVDLMPPQNGRPYHTIKRPETSTFRSPGIKLEISSAELEVIKPPAPHFKPTVEVPTQSEELINMRPPAPNNENHIEAPRIKPEYVNIQRPAIHLPVTTTRSKTTATTFRPQFRNRTLTRKPTTLILDINNLGPIELGSESDEILKSSISATPVLTIENSSQSKIKLKPTLESTIIQGSSIINEDRNWSQNRTKVFPEQTKITTRYITSTKTITHVDTKTQVINRSHGIPITTTRVETSTVFETVTETLIKPTIITSIHPTTTTFVPVIRGTTLPTHRTTTEEIIEGFISSEDDLDEFIIRPDETDTDAGIVRIDSKEKSDKNKNRRPVDNDSILVVLTDKKQGSIMHIDHSIINPSLYGPFNDTLNTIAESDDVSRGEEESNDGADHFLLSGILIASPPHLDKGQQSAAVSIQCLPDCSGSKNEHCQRVEGIVRCVCRPGFARMFPDRPCKRKFDNNLHFLKYLLILLIISAIYTYIMKIGLNRNGKNKLKFNDSFRDKTNVNYTDLATITHSGADRMFMQSDLRDIYHSIKVIGFNKSHENNGVVGEMFIQLAENTNEKKLRETVKKYLRMNNYSLGGTELYANPLISDIETYDFDECSGIVKSHDCSDHSQCFNLQGTYTCSCLEGFTDLSVNPIYPGRMCVPEQTGCEKCHYHGTCMTKSDEFIVCECFQWYTGQNCQVNLKCEFSKIPFKNFNINLELFFYSASLRIGCCRFNTFHVAYDLSDFDMCKEKES